MERLNLTGKGRESFGKGPSGRLRSSGRVPAVLYGHGIKGALHLSLDAKELDKALHTGAGGNVIVSLRVDEAAARTVMFKEITRHPLSGSISHIDFVEVSMDKKIVVEVPVHVVGKAAGLANGGILQQESRKIRIECLPTAIPASIDVDVTALGIGQALHVSDVQLPEGIRAVDKGITIVSVVAPTAEVAPKTADEVKAELAKSFEEKEEEKKEEGAAEEKKK